MFAIKCSRSLELYCWTTALAATLGVGGLGLAQSGQAEDPEHGLGLTFVEEPRYASIPLAVSPLFGDLPARVDLSKDFPLPGDQGKQGSCVGWAVGYALKSYQERVERNWDLASPQHQFSPSYIYNQIKPQGNCNTGSTFIDALNLLRKEGVAKITDFPYSDDDCKAQPGSALRKSAREFAIAEWRRVNVQDEVETKTQLAAGYPVLLGMRVDKEFMRLRGEDPYQAYKGPSLGGHAIIVVGYDDSRGCFRLLNSWGSKWGDSGYCWISYKALQQVAKEGYAARDVVIRVDEDDDVADVDDPVPTRPEATIGRPIVTHNLLIQDPRLRGRRVPSMNVAFSGRVKGAKGRKLQVVVRYFYASGVSLRANPREPHFRDAYGFVANGTDLMPVSSDDFELGSLSASLPYYALNFAPTGGRARYPLALRADLFLDGFIVAQSSVVPFTLVW